MSPRLLPAALWYARRGWRVFPVVPRKKLPLIKGWPQLATTDLRQIERWWHQEPAANVGMACGAGSGVYVLDIDQHGVDGEAALERLEQHLGDLPPTVAQRTGSGGRQLLFAWPNGHEMRNKAGSRPPRHGGREFRLPPGIDTRGEGGFVVVPPSIHPCGDAYRWAAGPHERELAPLPERWIAALERRPMITIEVPVRPFQNAQDDDAIARIATHVARQGEGNRNSALYWAARKLVELKRLGLVRDLGEQDLLAAAQQIGLPQHEARATLASAKRAGGER